MLHILFGRQTLSVLFLFSAAGVLCADEPLSKEIFLTQAAEGWKRLELQNSANSCTVWKETRIEDRSGKKKQENTLRYTLNTLDGMFSLQTTSTGTSRTGSHFVVQNKDYAFEVGQEMKEDEWAINYCGDAGNDAIQSEVKTVMSVLKSAWSVYAGIPVREIITDTGLQFRNCNIKAADNPEKSYSGFRSTVPLKVKSVKSRKGRFYSTPASVGQFRSTIFI
ncbi:MAG: hypothetical protein LBT46_11225 [Planctomycetaceae bacterium]|jgi:hypothetical protein|nr:hypothetical protein [Planctomycetaceae bacterium]